jgi:hypothetical protein
VRKSKSSECLEKIRSTVFIFFEILSGTSAAKFFCENTLTRNFHLLGSGSGPLFPRKRVLSPSRLRGRSPRLSLSRNDKIFYRHFLGPFLGVIFPLEWHSVFATGVAIGVKLFLKNLGRPYLRNLSLSQFDWANAFEPKALPSLNWLLCL